MVYSREPHRAGLSSHVVDDTDVRLQRLEHLDGDASAVGMDIEADLRDARAEFAPVKPHPGQRDRSPALGIDAPVGAARRSVATEHRDSSRPSSTRMSA